LRSAIRHRIVYEVELPPFGPDGICLAPEALQAYVDAIVRERPHLLAGMAAYLYQIGRHVQRTGQKLRVPVLHPQGSLSTPGQRQFFVEAFGADVFDVYGASEFGAIACQCESRQGLHVAMGSFIVEILRDGRPAAEGELGHIAVTSLDNWAMPLIRYLPGDVGRWYQGGCKCGRTTQAIDCHGRIHGLVVTAKGKTITEEDMMNFAYFKLGLEHFQLVERKRGQFDFMVVPAPGEKLDRQGIREATSQLLDGPERVGVFPVKTIYPEPTGKFRFVKSASCEDFR